ncbi:hypothetical protein, partial [Bifidobacterium pseudocatenulatum]|uniref:hypothetical protein n=1 Tax=Bifidobacterium pseudocatenulatum TaxID=28026 RepID=UPI0022DEBD62
AKGRYQSLLQYLLISFDIADIATRNLNRRLQKRLAIMRYVIANLFVFFFGGGGSIAICRQYIAIIQEYLMISR